MLFMTISPKQGRSLGYECLEIPHDSAEPRVTRMRDTPLMRIEPGYA